MDKINRSVLLVVRHESMNDFKEIARRARKIDPYIEIFVFAGRVNSHQLPPLFFEHPLLAIYLCNSPPDYYSPRIGLLANQQLNKIEEYNHFKNHNIPSLPIEAFDWGMTPDKSIYGDYVVLKPQNIMSTGKDINLVPTDLIPSLRLDDFPEDHLIRKDKYYIQKFVNTGDRPMHYRAYVFLNEIVLTAQSISKISTPKVIDIKNALNISVASNSQEYRDVILFTNKTITDFALKIAQTFTKIPLLGIDILIDDATKELFVLEVNAGGNTWVFSSKIAEHFRHSAGGKKKLVLQYNAWDRAAEALVRKTHELAK